MKYFLFFLSEPCKAYKEDYEHTYTYKIESSKINCCLRSNALSMKQSEKFD